MKKSKTFFYIIYLSFACIGQSLASAPTVVGFYEGQVQGTAISMKVEQGESTDVIVMRQRTDAEKPIFAETGSSERAAILKSALFNQVFASGLTSENTSCFHPLPPSPPLPLICRVPENILFKFTGPYGWIYEFKSTTGAIYIFPRVDHLTAIDLNFSDKLE
jgi:hypothetical protein